MLKKEVLHRLFLLICLAVWNIEGSAQMSYYQDQFAGGVTAAGYSPAYFQTAATTGVITVNIAPGSTIRQAYLIVGRLGNAPATNITLNGSPITLNATNQVSPTFNTIYGGASGVHVVNVASIVSPGVNTYNLGLPAQASTSNRYQDFYLYISYNNPGLGSVSTAIFLNTQNAANIMNWGTLNVNYPFNTVSGNVGYSFFGGYECSSGDGERLYINGTLLGTVWGQDINSGQCGGPVGSFFYNNGVLSALSDDNVNQAVTGPEALSNVTSLITNNSTTVAVSHQHANGSATDNHPWAAVFVWNSCQVPTVTAVASQTSICPGQNVTLTGGGASTYTWNPGNLVGSSVNVSPAATTIYTVVGTNSTNCTNSATVSVTVNPLPTLTVSASPTAVCIGQSSTLSVLGASTYTWNPGNLNGNTVSVSPASTNIYTVTGQSAGGCLNTNTLSLTVNPLPVVNPGSNSPVCTGGTLNLNMAAMSTYTWSGPSSFSSNLQNPSINNVTTANSGIYTVSVTDPNGCQNSGTTSVTINPLPVANPTNSGPYCAGSVLSLSVSSAASYTWTGPNSFSSNLQNPTVPNGQLIDAGVYSVTVMVGGGCISSGTTNVVVNPSPTPTAQSNSPVCEGQTINLMGQGGTSYTWTGPSSFINTTQNTSVANASITNGGNYTLTVSDASGCTSSTITNVVVNPLPVIVVASPSVCAAQTLNLSATGGNTYLWSGPNGFTSNQSNPAIPNATLSMSGPYNVTVTTAAGCSNTAVTNATVAPLPIPSALTGGAVCVGSTLMLSSSGGSSYSWTGPNGFSSNQQNPNISNATLNAGGVYNVIVTANTCTASASVSGTVNPLPTPVLNSNSPVCIGSAINFNALGGVSYSWSGPQGFTSSNQNPSISSSAINNSGNYTLTVTDANNCVNTAVLNVTVNPQPTPMATGASVCQNGNTSLSANGGVSYSWTGPNGFTSSNQNPLLSNVQPISAGQYTVLVTNANSCTNTAVASLAVNPAPTPNVQSNSPVCLNQSLNLTATGGLTYSWTGPNGFISNLQNPSFNATSMAYSGNYMVTVTDANNCSATAVLNATVNPLPTATIFSGNNRGCAPICVTFSVQSSPAAATTNWILGDGSFTNNSNTASRCYNAAGIYTVSASVTDNNGCPGTAVYTVEAYPQPVADFNHAPIKPIINVDGDVSFTDASHGPPIVSWNWYFMNTAQYQSTEQNPHFNYTEPGSYPVALIVKSEQGCLDTLIKLIEVGEDFGIYVPNAFTPNGDGLNDTFQPKGFGIVKYEMQIFDRWGEKIFETNDFEKGWDGIRQKKNDVNYTVSKEDVYTWRIKVTSVFGKAHEYTGHVTIIK
jgi:gliding motility-associated-like protein